VERLVNKCKFSRLIGLTVVAAPVLFLGSAHAQVTLATGNWSSQYTLLLNGKNSQTLLSLAQTDLVNSLPTSMQAQATSTLNAAKTKGIATVCLGSTDVASINSPAKIFNTLSTMNPYCSFKVTKTTSSAAYFSGTCTDPLGYTGPLSGSLKVGSAKKWTASFSGIGTVPTAVLTAMGLTAGSKVYMSSSSTSSWVSATCPATTVASAN